MKHITYCSILIFLLLSFSNKVLAQEKLRPSQRPLATVQAQANEKKLQREKMHQNAQPEDNPLNTSTTTQPATAPRQASQVPTTVNPAQLPSRLPIKPMPKPGYKGNMCCRRQES